MYVMPAILSFFAIRLRGRVHPACQIVIFRNLFAIRLRKMTIWQAGCTRPQNSTSLDASASCHRQTNLPDVALLATTRRRYGSSFLFFLLTASSAALESNSGLLAATRPRRCRGDGYFSTPYGTDVAGSLAPFQNCSCAISPGCRFLERNL